MKRARRLTRASRYVLTLVLSVATATLAQAAPPIRPQAVLDATFDEPAGDALDRSLEGRFKNRGTLANGAARVASPFWSQEGRQALLLDAPQKQYLQIADSGDIDRPDALTVSFFFLNLHELDDAAAHGILAKRVDESMSANYGINFVPKGNVVQVYLNHGTGFRFPSYSLQDVLGSRRRVYLTATFERSDAPAPDADTDADDVRVRLFANGKQVKPSAVNAAVLADNDAWITDVDAAKLVNDAPLILGATTAGTEFTSGLIDEFSLFARALNPEEVAQLFVEVAGTAGPEMAQRELQEPSSRPAPQIANVSLRGLRAGDRTRLTVTGANLGPAAQVALPIANVKQNVASESNLNMLVVDVTLPADTPPGYYPLNIVTANGLSNTVTVAIDRLPQSTAKSSSVTSPASLPAAFSGELSGSEQGRVYFLGRAGQRVVADVDARRLGATFDPVVEIKSGNGTPLVIEWGKPPLRGDARAELVLPEDGSYSVELHDLAYKAPGGSPFRLKIGNIAVVDTSFPPAAARGSEASIQPIGSGIPAGTSFSVSLPSNEPKSSELLSLPAKLEPFGPAPALKLSDSIEVIEVIPAAGQLQTVDAQFAGAKHVPIAVNGRISKPGEQDRYLLQVTAGQKLNLSLAGRSINSPIEPHLAILKNPEGTLLAQTDESPGNASPQLTFDVPQGMTQVIAAVADLYGRGSDATIYRLNVIPAGQPDFSMSALASQITLPENGTAIIRVDVARAGYNGPIQLSVHGDPSISVQPAEIEAGDGTRKLFVTLKRAGGHSADNLKRLTLVGESVGLDPVLRHATSISATADATTPPAFREELAAFIDSPSALSTTIATPPSVLFKGLLSDIPVNVSRAADLTDKTISLSLVSTEATRPVDPKDPAKGNLPRVAGTSSVAPSGNMGVLKVTVPLDVAEGDLTCVVRADARPHAWSKSTYGTAYSQPIRIAVRDAVAVDVVAESLALTAGMPNTIRGTVKRSPGFAAPVVVVIAGLPAGYTAPAITVPADKEQFELSVTAGAEAQPGDIPNVTLNVSAEGAGAILPSQPLALKVAPKK